MVEHTQEIERKWLVRDLPRLEELKGDRILQGYLAISSDGPEVRIRRKGDTYFETIKSQGGLSRDEIEVEISHASSARSGPPQKGDESKRPDTHYHGTAINLNSMCIEECLPT